MCIIMFTVHAHVPKGSPTQQTGIGENSPLNTKSDGSATPKCANQRQQKQITQKHTFRIG